MADKKVKSITSKSEDMAQWYTDVCVKAELMSYSNLKGFIVYRPDGYALWESIQHYFDERIKKLGVRNVYLPSLIPMSLLQKEKQLVEGFAPECAVVTKGGSAPLQEELVVRPTSETLFCDHFKDIVHSYNDLPVKYNQWCSVVRWEKTTRPFLRGSEFLWQEGHTLHETKDEANEFALTILKEYAKMGEDLLAIPFVTGVKTDSEKFAGAEKTYTIEAMMPDGQALQCGTSHCLGQNFTKAYDIKYTNRNNETSYPYYDSWGISTRLLGALIMVHGDDEGLVLPPKIAPTQVVIIPIRAENDPNVIQTCKKIEQRLNEKGVRVTLDSSNKSPGWKFAQYEMKGIPLRIELGPKDLQNNQVTISKRYNSEKETVKLDDVENRVLDLLSIIQKEMFKKAEQILDSKTFICHNKNEINEVLSTHKGFAKLIINKFNEKKVEIQLKELYNASPRVIPFDQRPFQKEDSFFPDDKADEVIMFARAY